MEEINMIETRIFNGIKEHMHDGYNYWHSVKETHVLEEITLDIEVIKKNSIEISIKRGYDGSVIVKSGSCVLLMFTTDGNILLSTNVPENLGFKLDSKGRIQIV